MQGFLKTHPSLTALITHHSVMPELLPVPLTLNRHNPTFSNFDQDNEDEDYDTLTDFSQLMQDITLGREYTGL